MMLLCIGFLLCHGLKSNQKMVGYFYEVLAIIALVHISCHQCYYQSKQGSHQDKMEYDFPPLEYDFPPL